MQRPPGGRREPHYGTRRPQSSLMSHPYACHSNEHHWTRRQVLGATLGLTVASSSGGPGRAMRSLLADTAKKQGKQVVFVWLDGAMSQFESWDPKPGTPFGGPFRSIATSVPGVQLSELMPKMAQRMQHVSIVRSMHTRFEDHSKAVIPIQQGDPKNRGVTYPLFGSAVARWCDTGASELPPYVHIKPGSGGFQVQDAGFLGAQFGALTLGDGKAPPNLLPTGDTVKATDTERAEKRQAARDAARERLNRAFQNGRRSESPEAYAQSYRVARQMARRADLFDPGRLDPADVTRYGGGEFARHMLQARRLIEAGVTFVKVTMYHWDTHGDNFNCHQDGVPIVDAGLAGLIDDLIARGLYERTLVVVMSEFGRTPKINGRVGRDHWPECWSVAMGGGGLRGGVIVGRTNELGTFNAHEEYDVGHLFHTFFQALGVDPKTTEYDNGGQPLPIAHDDCHVIRELLA